MIIFLYGKDSYRRKEKEKEIIGLYRKKHQYFDFQKFDFLEDKEKNNFTHLKDFLNQSSLFGYFKLALVYNFFSYDKTKLVELAKNQLDREKMVLVISNKDCPKDFEPLLLKKPAISQRFGDLTSEKLAFFIRKESQKRNITLSLKAVKFLIQISQYFEQEKSWFIVKELEKLSLLGAELDLGNILSFYSGSIKENIFYLIKKINPGRDLKISLVYLEKIISQIDPAYLFNLLAYQRKFTLKLADYDCLVKSGKIDYETALLDFTLDNK